MSTTEILFRPLTIGNIDVPNRIWMAPLTRCRAGLEHLPNALMAEYYAQRASAGLIIAEATMAMEGNSASPDLNKPQFTQKRPVLTV